MERRLGRPGLVSGGPTKQGASWSLLFLSRLRRRQVPQPDRQRHPPLPACREDRVSINPTTTSIWPVPTCSSRATDARLSKRSGMDSRSIPIIPTCSSCTTTWESAKRRSFHSCRGATWSIVCAVGSGIRCEKTRAMSRRRIPNPLRAPAWRSTPSPERIRPARLRLPSNRIRRHVANDSSNFPYPHPAERLPVRGLQSTAGTRPRR